ncbi:MAG: hypothetical protein HYV29_15905 [Ignavibacteriales bacterium]|nr:hypothetical protein [Ignavibacteriales bacterium]
MKPKPNKLMPSLYGGLLIATLWAVPGLNLINCLCCAGVLLGGFLAVLLYQKDFTPETDPLIKNDCIQLGIFSGLIASVAAVIIQVIVTLVFGDVAVEMMMRLIEKMNVEMPPEFYALIEQAKEEEPNLFGSILAVFFYILPNTLFSVLGALIGWNVFKPKN